MFDKGDYLRGRLFSLAAVRPPLSPTRYQRRFPYRLAVVHSSGRAVGNRTYDLAYPQKADDDRSEDMIDSQVDTDFR